MKTALFAVLALGVSLEAVAKPIHFDVQVVKTSSKVVYQTRTREYPVVTSTGETEIHTVMYTTKNCVTEMRPLDHQRVILNPSRGDLDSSVWEKQYELNGDVATLRFTANSKGEKGLLFAAQLSNWGGVLDRSEMDFSAAPTEMPFPAQGLSVSTYAHYGSDPIRDSSRVCPPDRLIAEIPSPVVPNAELNG